MKPLLSGLLALFLMTDGMLAAEPKLVLETTWGKGPGQLGYYNHTVPGFEEMVPMGPMGLAVGPGGEFAIADTFNDRICVYGTDGKLQKTLTGPLLKLPWTIAFAAEGELAAALGESEHIVRLGPDGQVKAAFGGRGEEPGKFAQITALRSGPTGLLFVGDLGLKALAALDPKGREMGDLEWEGTGLGVTREGLLLDLEHDEEEGYSVRARRLDGEQRYAFAIPGDGLEDGKLLGIDQAENVYVRFTLPNEHGTMHVVRFTADGKKVEDLGQVPFLSSESSPAVIPKGGMLWFDYDAAKAPAGKVKVFRRE